MKIWTQIFDFEIMKNMVKFKPNKAMLKIGTQLKPVKFLMTLELQSTALIKVILQKYQELDYFRDTSDFLVFFINSNGQISDVTIEPNSKVQEVRQTTLTSSSTESNCLAEVI